MKTLMSERVSAMEKFLQEQKLMSNQQYVETKEKLNQFLGTDNKGTGGAASQPLNQPKKYRNKMERIEASLKNYFDGEKAAGRWPS